MNGVETFTKTELEDALQELEVRMAGLRYILSQVDFEQVEVSTQGLEESSGGSGPQAAGRIKKRCFVSIPQP